MGSLRRRRKPMAGKRITNKEPRWIAETLTVTREVPTGHIVCDVCFGRRTVGHTRFCYWHPKNKAKDDAAIRRERGAR